MPEPWERRSDPRPEMAGREMVVVANIDDCSLCGVPSAGHGRRLGWGHLGYPEKRYVEPSADLRARREAARHEQSTGLLFGGFRPDGERATHLVKAECRCGATVMATPEQSPNARCTSCLQADIDEKGTSRA